MADDKDNKLLNEIKNYLEITWDDSLGTHRRQWADFLDLLRDVNTIFDFFA